MAQGKDLFAHNQSQPDDTMTGELFPDACPSGSTGDTGELPSGPPPEADAGLPDPIEAASADEPGEADGPPETDAPAPAAENTDTTAQDPAASSRTPEARPAPVHNEPLPEPTLDENAMTVLERRYLRKNEDGAVIEQPADMFMRVARNIAAVERTHDADADVEGIARTFYTLMASLDFLPNSPTLMNAGRELQQLSACFVLPVGDSLKDIFETVKHTALIHQSGGGTGFSFSRLRPKNDIVKSTKGVSSGPVSFMTVFDAATEAIKQGGTRRGANMGILRIDHPDIEEFIHAKANLKRFNNFNISVALTEDFMQAVRNNTEYDLKNPRTGRPVEKRNAKKIFDEIVRMAWTSGEPGIIFIDRLNADNPTPAAGAIEATNPCGEQPLLPYESCNLGSINLSHMVGPGGTVDFDRLGKTVDTAVHFLDNVIDANRYPLPEIDTMTKANRKIGLGVMGFAEMLIQMNIPYDSEEALAVAEDVMGFIQASSREASIKLALARGSFPNFAESTPAKQGVRMLRNATTTTIAPTGTISIIAGASSGIEPIFALSYIRNVMDDDELVEVNRLFAERAKRDGFYSNDLMKKIAKTGGLSGIPEVPDRIKRIFATAHDINPEWHIRMQAVFQKYTDNAVSKTVNFPESATEDDIRRVYELAYELGCKGVTVYRDKSRQSQVLNIGEVNREDASPQLELPIEGLAPAVVALTPRRRADVTWGTTRKMKTGCGDLYVTINEDETGLFGLFTTMGKAGGCASSQNEAIGRMVSLAWRSGIQARQVVKQLIDISCHSHSGFGENKILSCADAVAKAILTHLASHGFEAKPEKSALGRGACPDCGGIVEHEGGCLVCHVCGYSECA